MRAWAAHAIFAAILVGSLTIQKQTADALGEGVSLEPAVVRIAESRGWSLREHRTTSGMVLPALVFDAPGCSQPVLVSLRLSTFEEETVMQYDTEQGYARSYIYFDRIWDSPDPRATFVQRMKYGFLAMFGMTEYEPSRYLLLVETPPHCQEAEAIDWRPVWNRHYLAAARASDEATTGH